LRSGVDGVVTGALKGATTPLLCKGVLRIARSGLQPGGRGCYDLACRDIGTNPDPLTSILHGLRHQSDAPQCPCASLAHRLRLIRVHRDLERRQMAAIQAFAKRVGSRFRILGRRRLHEVLIDEALRAIDSTTFDVLSLDVQASGRSHRGRADAGNVPILFGTGYGREAPPRKFRSVRQGYNRAHSVTAMMVRLREWC